MRVSTRDLYRLRRAHLDTRHAALRLELTRHRLGELLLELERRYGLLGCQGTIDIHTGEVNGRDHPERPAQPDPQGPEG